MAPGTASTAGGSAGPGARGALHPLWQWDVFFGGAGIVMAGVTLLSAGPLGARGGAAAALVALCGGYLGYGRRHLLRDEEHPPMLLPVGALAIFTIALWFHPMAQIGWGVLFPMLFLGCRLPVAAASSALAAVLPSIVLLIRDGPGDPFLPFSLLIGAAAGGAAILFGVWIAQVMERSAQRAALIAQLEASQEEVELLSHEAGIAAERTRLAREIHDTLAQGFTSIVALVQAAESELDGDLPAARRHLDLATRTARENLAEARAMVAELTPSPLAAGTLAEAIRRRAELIGTQSCAAVRVHARDTGALPMAVEVVLLRTAQEALANIGKHAAAGRITVELSATDDIVRLVVADDGTGFDPDGPTDGYGLAGMRRRAEDIGGELIISSRRGAGTTVTLEVPR